MSTTELVDQTIHNMFVEVVKENDLEYGDIEPLQVAKLDNLKIDLVNIVDAFIKGNKES